jgi:hypothetical protein
MHAYGQDSTGGRPRSYCVTADAVARSASADLPRKPQRPVSAGQRSAALTHCEPATLASSVGSTDGSSPPSAAAHGPCSDDACGPGRSRHAMTTCDMCVCVSVCVCDMKYVCVTSV